jgi:hypothetical protein
MNPNTTAKIPAAAAGTPRSFAPLSLPPVAEAADSLAEEALEEPEEVAEAESVSEASESLAVDEAELDVLLPEEGAEKAEVVLLVEG